MDETATTIITNLTNHNYTNIHNHFSNYLHPFSLLISPNSQNPNKKTPSQKSSSSIRSLAKTYLLFLNKSLTLIPNCLSQSPKQSKSVEFVPQLFDCYKLCLDCLEAISSELGGKPYSVHLQRVLFVHCLLRWERYEDAIGEGVRVLKDLDGVNVEGFSRKGSGWRFVPLVVVDGGSKTKKKSGGGGGGDEKVKGEFVQLVVNVALYIVQAVSLSKTKDGDKYKDMLVLLDEVRPWFRYLDADACSKLQVKLLTYMRNATMFLVREVKHFEGELVSAFCAATFNEHTMLLNNQSRQGRTGGVIEEFVKFVSICTYKCRSACSIVRCDVGMHLLKSADEVSQDLAHFVVILKLYAMGLYLSEFSIQSNGCCSPDSGGTFSTLIVRGLPEGCDKLQDLSSLLESGKNYYCANLEDCVLLCEDRSACFEPDDSGSKACISTNGEDYLYFYLSALKFVCWPLAEFVNSERKTIVSEEVGSPLGDALNLIQEALLEYCHLFLHCQKQSHALEEIDTCVLSISVAILTLSLKLNIKIKGSKRLVSYLLSDKCISSLQPQKLKYLIGMLHNVFVEFYRDKRLEEASKAVKLCCRASWSRCLLLCEMLVGKLKGLDGDLTETMIADSVNEACKVNSYLFDILHQLDSHSKMAKEMVYSLEKWCLARKLFGKLQTPEALIKRWVKILCKSFEKSDKNALESHLLYSQCMTNHNMSAEMVGVILEQELLAYQEFEDLYPNFSRRMQMEIIDILLQNVYDSSKCLHRCTLLVKKVVLSRAYGTEGLESVLSEAIKLAESNKNRSNGITHKEASLRACQLAVVYSLRAMCMQETNPKSKEVFDIIKEKQKLFGDVRKALDLLKKIDVPDFSSNDKSNVGPEYVLLLLYQIADLLSIKGNMTLHEEVLNVIFKVMKGMNISLEKCVSLLWGSRRLNHALCVVPINEILLNDLAKHYCEDAESLDFWISRVMDHKALSIGLQQNFTYLSSLFSAAFHQRKHSLRTDISVDEVKEVASHLISNVPVPSCSSAFLAGYLYYDLSERLFTSGHVIESLLCAKEAHRLRGKLLQEHFSYSLKPCENKHDDSDETMPKPSFTVSSFTVLNQVATRAWSNNGISQDSDGVFLNPWNVLGCYLESTLQVGIIHETIGNGAEAEAQFSLGKSISCSQSLPLFIVTFSSCLGKVYIGKGILGLAQKELETAQQVLAIERKSITCSRCLLMLECTINEQLGDLYRRGVHCAAGNPYESSLRSLISLEKGDLTVWLEETNLAYPVVQNEVAGDARETDKCTAAQLGVGNASKPERTKLKTEVRKSRKTKKASESLATVKSCTVEQNARVTRSRTLSSQRNRVDFVEGLPNISNSYPNGEQERETTSVSKKVMCQKCFLAPLKKDSLTCFIQMKWEFVRRRQILRLLIGLGQCKGASAGNHTARKIYSKCISILLGGNDCHCSSSQPLELYSIGEEIPGDILAGECAEVLYYFCWFSLEALYSNDRSTLGDVGRIQMSQIVSSLKHSFVLSRDIPSLFQKVSKLLAVLYIVLGKLYSAWSSGEVLSENSWAAYFHQASVGTHHNVRFLTAGSVKHKSQMACKVKGSQAAGILTDEWALLRIAPESTKGLEACVVKFFENLPSTTIICMSVLGSPYASLLKELSHSPVGVHGWLLLSYLNADDQPAVLLLPLGSVLRDDSDEDTSPRRSIFGEKNVMKEWHSPWGCSALVDDIAPMFKSILRGNYVSCSSFPEEDTEMNRDTWWDQRNRLNKRLDNFLGDMEKKWFGPWRYLLLGRWSEYEPLNSAVEELVHEIKARCKLDINRSVLKIVMGGIKSANLEKERIPRLFLEKGCYIGGAEDCDRERCNTLDDERDKAEYVLGSVIEIMLAAVKKLEAEYCTRREPVVLVLDSDIQMLPWENMPIMREQEVYRMPSVSSIFVALQRRSVLEEAVSSAVRYPLIDPVDAFYLLNPSGDLNRTQAEFEEWFRLQNIQGKAGIVPATEELTTALESHDLFLYFGHGSGAQYIPSDKIQKLKNCAATLLMGCSSGSLNLNGQYAPVGTSLSYLLAGSPVVVANLWEVTDLDIDRFAKTVLKSFMDERSRSSTGCVQCSILAEEFKSMSVNEKKGNTKKGRGKKKLVDATPDISGGHCFIHKSRAGKFVSQARESCILKFLNGAAPVCYGVPTGIKKKRDI